MSQIFRILPLFLILTIFQLTHQLFSSKVSYSFSKVPSGIEQVFWCGADGRNVLVLTYQKHVYKSEDEGNTWKPIHPKLYEHGKRTAAKEEEIGEVQWIKTSTTDQNIVIFIGSQGVMWVSQDCGHTIKSLYQGRRIDSFQFHPTQSRWALASSINMCEDNRNFSDNSQHYIESPMQRELVKRSKPCDMKRQLFYTTDLGDTWKLIAEYVEQFDWAAVDNDHIKHGIPKTRILVTIDLNAHGDQLFGQDFDRNLNLMQSDDFFETNPIKLLSHGNKFFKSKDFLYVACSYRIDQDVSLFVAHRKTKFQNFKRVILPLEHLTEHSYTIIDTSEKAAIIHVDHIGGQSKFGHVYISDVTGASFSLSLQNNARESNGLCDIDRIWGLQGIYFANAVEIEQDQFFLQNQQRTGSMSQSSMYTSKPMYGYSNASSFARDQALSSSKKRMNEQYVENNDFRLQNRKKTYATFNKGGKWALVSPPETDSKGRTIKCKSNLGCSLHFHAVSTQSVIAPLYSYQSSPGLIIANGNIGPFLQMNPGVINTYLSRDGGKQWFEIAKGAHVYEFGNYGALIVMAPDMQPTKHVMYSWDEGLTWDYEVVSTHDIIIENIMIEPSASSQKFVVFGMMADQSSQGVIVHLDFTSMHQKACHGMFQTTSSSTQSDFEQWSPYDGRSGSKCLLGRHFTFTRRKRNSKCYIEGNLPGPRMMSCQCTEEDYQCDEGYGRETVNSPCKLEQDLVQFKTQFLRDRDKEHDSYSPQAVKKRECAQGSSYFISQGYRKVAGNTCYGGVDRNPKKHSCSRFSSSFSGTVIFLLTMILILFGVFVYCGPPTAFFDFLKNKGSTFWDRAKQIIGGKDANRSDNLGQYDRVGFAAVPDQYDPDDFDDDEYANREDQSKEILTPKKTPPDNKKNQEGEASKDLLADDDNEEEPLEL